MIFASLSDSFKYFHTADVFAALVRASIWSRHIIVRNSLFGLSAYSDNFGCRTFGASLQFIIKFSLQINFGVDYNISLIISSLVH